VARARPAPQPVRQRTLRIADCGPRRFWTSAFTGVTPNAPRPRKGGAYGGMSQISAGDGMLAPPTLRVSGDGRRVGGRFMLTGSAVAAIRTTIVLAHSSPGEQPLANRIRLPAKAPAARRLASAGRA
jgi:hypothetical protein